MVSKMGVIKKVPSEVKQLKRVIMTSRERRCHVRNVPDARESEVLSLFATIIDKYKVIMQDDVPHIFEAVFQCTLEMITKNFEDYPEHRLKFFSLLRAIATFCFRALIQLSSEQLKLVMDSVIWAFRHTERNIAETGLNLLLAMLKNFQKSDFCNQFYRTYFMQIEQEIFAVLTDTFHKPGFKLHVLVLQHLFSLVESDSLTEPLWDTVTVPHPYPSNADFVREYTIKLLSSSFPNMTPSEVAPRNTVGDVPLEWCKDEKHIGYDITGKKITKKEKQDKLDSFLATVDDSKNWRKIYDEYNDEEVELTKEESKLIRRMLKGEAPHADFDPYADYVDWFKWDDAIHPLSNAPEPKRRFIPSKWEAKKVVKYVRAIRKGLIKFDKPEEEPNVYLLWGDDSASDSKNKHLTYIPPPKLKFPGHEESYNPCLEYIPTEEEKASYELMYEEDRPKFIPKRFTSLRSIPAYENALKESFERCLDLYLCPRVRKKRINIDPESLKPKLPSRKDLRPYPNSCYLEYKGHTGPVTSISTDSSGQWLASGSTDGSVRIWEVETGRCLKIWQFDEAVKTVAWNPVSHLSILAVAMGRDLIILNTQLGTDEEQSNIKELLHLGKLPEPEDSVAAIVSWLQDEISGGIKMRHFKNISHIDWNRKGDYISLVMSSGETRGIVMHQISKKCTHKLPFKIRGIPVCTLFHPTRSLVFVASKKHIRVYNLLKKDDEKIKKLDTGLREISSMAIHPGGDNLIVGSKEGKMCWFDMDLSSKPYKTLKNHPKDITNVAVHRSYLLFASCSEDSSAYVFHGMVYNDLNQNPLIVPLEILRGHSSKGVLDCKFHPRQPWLFTAGADSIIKLYCH